MGRRKLSTTVYLTDKQRTSLRLLSESTRVPQAVMIRDALDAYLDTRRAEIPTGEPDPNQTAFPFAPSEPPECPKLPPEQILRARGFVTCSQCNQAYRDHPLDTVHVNSDGEPYLRIHCNGMRVKL